MVLLIYALIVVLGVGLDQLTKYLVSANFAIDASPDLKVWEGVFHIRCISNDGAAFGMLDEHRWLFMSVSTVVIIAVVALVIVKRKNIPLFLGITLSLIVSGGIGNMIDRVALGYVVDFIYFVPIDFPCFNVADSLVCIGAVLMFIYVLFFDTEKTKKELADAESTVAAPADADSAEAAGESGNSDAADASGENEDE